MSSPSGRSMQNDVIVGTPISLSRYTNDDLQAEYRRRFGAEPRIFRAPGRVNLIGEHTDYNEGFVMPAALEFSTWAAIAPSRDGKLHIASLNLNEDHRFDTGDSTPAGNWTDYVRGVDVMLRRAGYDVPAGNILIWGNVPIGAGLSSSASLEVAVCFALLAMARTELTGEQIARICQRAENEFVGARCGIMDQFIAIHGRARKAIMIDCRSLEHQLRPIPKQVAIVIANSMVKHELAASEYNKRRAECEEGVRIMQRSLPEARALRDVSVEQLEAHKKEMPDVIYRRCRHVIRENARVLEFASALESSALQRAGELMRTSHASLRDDYEVSCRELDLLVDIAASAGGIGSRMTGGGFGGCTVNLVKQEDVERFRSEVMAKYDSTVGLKPDIYVTRAAEGADEVCLEQPEVQRSAE